MSKLEEALEKANLLRRAPSSAKPARLDVFKTIKPPVRVSNPHLVTITQPDSPVAEEYRKLKSILIRATKENFLNTIMVTSSIDGEGKSLTAANLAITLAQEIDHTILLIDADLRNPKIHEYLGLGIQPEHGLSDYLTKDIDIADILVKTGIGNLVVIPAGDTVKNPVELLSSAKMQELIKELKHRYIDRYVIIDTPPIAPFAEAIAISSYVDGVLFVIKEGYAQKKVIDNAMSIMNGLNVLGVVFNGVNVENLDGHYSSYNYYKYRSRRKK